MPRNEAQVRFELIDPALEERGWNRRTDIRVEETAATLLKYHSRQIDGLTLDFLK